jgi:hypothetical protein
MGSMFRPAAQAAAGQPMTPMPKPPEPPRVVRMPTETDPSIVAAQQRTRAAAMRRAGRMSTILTDNTRETVGSSGQSLGA